MDKMEDNITTMTLNVLALIRFPFVPWTESASLDFYSIADSVGQQGQL
jgi:hypothetical protein